MRNLSVLGAVIIVAAVCITCIVLSPATDDPVVPEDGQDGGADQGHGGDGMSHEGKMHMTVGGRTFTVALEDNQTAAAFTEMLPMEIRMSELNGNEKYHYLPEELPRDDVMPGIIRTGDIMLYNGDCLVVFYETFATSYGYTPIGHVIETDGLAEALGHGSANVTFATSQAPSADPAE